MIRKVKIAPSLLSANFANLEADILKCISGGADLLHIDIMDGHFVPNITIGPLVVKAIKPVSAIPVDCHLMISEPDKYIPMFVEAGADMISVHVENAIHLHRTISLINSFKVKSGIVLNPVTPLEHAFDALEYCNFVLLMSVNPGFGGQDFISSFLRRCETLKDFIMKNRLSHIEIQVDGGVKAENAERIVHAGADILVCGSGIFNGDIIQNMNLLRKNAEKGLNFIV